MRSADLTRYRASVADASLLPDTEVAPAADLVAVAPDVHRYALAEKADATRRAYRTDFTIFTAWCQSRRGIAALAATPEAVAAFLAEQASAGTQTVHPDPAARRHQLRAPAGRLAVAGDTRRRAGRHARHPPDRGRRGRAKGAGDRRAHRGDGDRDRGRHAARQAGSGAAAARLRRRVPSRRAGRAANRGPRVRAGRLAGPYPPQQGRPGREGAGDRHPARQTLRPSSRCRSGFEPPRSSAVPCSAASTAMGVFGGSDGASVALIIKRHADAVGLDPAAFAGHSLRAGLPDQRGRGRRRRAADDGGVPAQAGGDRAGLRAAGEPVQRARWGGFL